MSVPAHPKLAETILETMALRPDAPMTERLLYDALEGSPLLRGLTLADVEAAVIRLVNLDQLVRTSNAFTGTKPVKLTTAGKLNLGIC